MFSLRGQYSCSCRATVHYHRQLSPRGILCANPKHHICVVGNGITGTGHSPDVVGGEMASRPPYNIYEHAGASDHALLHDTCWGRWGGRTANLLWPPLHDERLMRGNTRMVSAWMPDTMLRPTSSHSTPLPCQPY